MKEAPLEPVHLPGRTIAVRQWSWRLLLGAALAGAVGALAAAGVRLGFRGLEWIFTGSSADLPVAAAHLASWRRALTPVAGALGATAVLLWQRRASRCSHDGDMYVDYVEAVRHQHGRLGLKPNLWRTASAAFSVATGAAVGREGSMIQFAASLASMLAASQRWLCFTAEERRFLVTCGIAGGVTAAYNAPVAAVFFAAEIVLGSVAWRELPLLALAAFAGWSVSGPLLGWDRLYPASVTLTWRTAVQGGAVWQLPLLAVAAGVLGPVYQWLLGSLQSLRRVPLALVLGAASVGLLSLRSPAVWGNGDAGLRAALHMGPPWSAGVPAQEVGHVLLLRVAATLACVWTGTVGGVFTPTLFVGGAAGSLLAQWCSVGTDALCAVAGMSLLMAAVTHAPLMAALMAVELTGNWKMLPVLVPLNYVAWGVARRLSPRAMYAIASQAPGRR